MSHAGLASTQRPKQGGSSRFTTSWSAGIPRHLHTWKLRMDSSVRSCHPNIHSTIRTIPTTSPGIGMWWIYSIWSSINWGEFLIKKIGWGMRNTNFWSKRWEMRDNMPRPDLLPKGLFIFAARLSRDEDANHGKTNCKPSPTVEEIDVPKTILRIGVWWGLPWEMQTMMDFRSSQALQGQSSYCRRRVRIGLWAHLRWTQEKPQVENG